jgi:hypothetical protein
MPAKKTATPRKPPQTRAVTRQVLQGQPRQATAHRGTTRPRGALLSPPKKQTPRAAPQQKDGPHSQSADADMKDGHPEVSAASPHWSTLTYIERDPWVQTVEDDLPSRPHEKSDKAILNTRAPVDAVKRIMIPATGLKSEDIVPTGYVHEILIRNLTPEIWPKALATLTEFQGAEAGCNATLTPPPAYLSWADHSLVLRLKTLSNTGNPYSGKEVAALMHPTPRTPRPIRILRMYKSSHERANCVRLIYKTIGERDNQENYKLKIGDDLCNVTSFRTPPLFATARPRPARDQGQHSKNK